MKVKKWHRYVVYVTLIFLLTYLGNYIIGNRMSNNVGPMDPYINNVLMFVFFGLIGVILGIEHLLLEISKEGKWAIDLPKIILLGIPSLVFSLGYCIYYSNILLFSKYLYQPILTLIVGVKLGNSIEVFQFVFGYIIITSFIKKQNIK